MEPLPRATTPVAASTQHAYKHALQVFQSHRLRRDHRDLVVNSQYRALGEFIFTEIYGPRDFSARDIQARSLRPFLRVIPGLGMHHIAELFSLLELSSALDDTLVETLIQLGAPLPFDEPTYERAYRLADNYVLRRRQLNLTRVVLCTMHRLAHHPLIGLPLHRSGALATAMGLAEIHRFLCLGHRAFQPVRDIRAFVQTLEARERARLDRIYALTVDVMDVELTATPIADDAS